MKRVLKFLIKIILAGVLAIALINLWVIVSQHRYVKDLDEIKDMDCDCVLVLGAGVWGDEPSPLLRDRIIMGVRSFEAADADYILMTGDNLYDDYNEPAVMTDYAIRLGADGDKIRQDRYGLRTYDSMWRARNVFECNKIIVVTQSYHISRALYIARGLGMEAYGVTSDLDWYGGNPWYFTREIAARVKEFFYMFVKPEARFPQ